MSQTRKELIITPMELKIIKENLNWKCPVGNDPTYCPDGCSTKNPPCDELTKENGKLVYKCPYMRQWVKIYNTPNKKNEEFTTLREREWKRLLENCEECGAHQEWFENKTYEDECDAYRNAVWKMHLLNEGKATVWNNELR